MLNRLLGTGFDQCSVLPSGCKCAPRVHPWWAGFSEVSQSPGAHISMGCCDSDYPHKASRRRWNGLWLGAAGLTCLFRDGPMEGFCERNNEGHGALCVRKCVCAAAHLQKAPTPSQLRPTGKASGDEPDRHSVEQGAGKRLPTELVTVNRTMSCHTKHEPELLGFFDGAEVCRGDECAACRLQPDGRRPVLKSLASGRCSKGPCRSAVIL